MVCSFFWIIFFNYCIGSCDNYTSILYTKPILLEPSKISVINWRHILLNMLKDVLFFDNIKHNSVLLVNLIKNDTNGILQTSNITNILIQCIVENTKKYNVVGIEVLNSVYREFGIFPEDNRNSYNFSMKIANYLKADYILYGIADGDSQKPNLKLQLILVKTGEIVRVVNGST